jgi:hypothetical protein
MGVQKTQSALVRTDILSIFWMISVVMRYQRPFIAEGFATLTIAN